MIIETCLTDKITDFLKEDLIINLNIMGILENKPEVKIYVDNIKEPHGVFVENGYMHYIYSKDDSFIDEVCDTYLKDGYFGFSGVESSIAQKIRSRYELDWESPCTLYYMPEKNLDLRLIKNPVRSIDIKDAETIDKFYQFRGDGSIFRIKDDIQNRPSSAVYINGEIASWVLVHEDNSMGIMYTKDEYRHCGYAVDVTIDLASKVINSGRIPFIQIIKGNNMSPGLARKCGFIEWGKIDWFGIAAKNHE